MRQAFFARFDREGTGAASAFLGRLLRTALVGLPLIVGGATTEAQTLASLPSPSAAIEKNGGARPVAAWVDFCRRHPTECTVDTSEPATIAMTSEVWRTILSVNRRTNARIKPKTDMEHWGVVDRWDFPEDGYGDCEDYQLLKRKLLAERGLSRRAMRMTVVIDDLGEGHAVLMIRTDRGDYILDNKTSAVLPWRDTGYTYVKREGQDSTAWVSLGGVGSPVATANR
jgi:predicted transglutaminase-like cysteine proteinase